MLCHLHMGKVRFTTGRRLLIVITSPPGSSSSCEFFVMICAPQVFINHVDLGLISHHCISPCFLLPGSCGDIGRQKNGVLKIEMSQTDKIVSSSICVSINDNISSFYG